MLTVKYEDEVFKKVYKNYLVSNYGRVYSLKTERFLKLRKNSKGYLRFEDSRQKDGIRDRKMIFVHIAVVQAFGDCKGKRFKHNSLLTDIDHLDRDKQNNSISNLELVTHLENVKRYFCQRKQELVTGGLDF